ncbi:DMT family transporter [Nocardiopsis gilva]|uniref:DMT family transporter n=1 Tax=Nocardiopsis gilva TaxID=280236 RepID=UPI00034815B6|nr:DMT family transporter [Nocardiopsis gilva]
MAALGVLAFSMSFPATAWALDGFGPWSTTALRCGLAGLVALWCLRLARVPLPSRDQWSGMSVVAVGCVVGFPLLSTLALTTSTASNAAVVIGALPIATAAIGAARSRTRLSRTFWAAALVGAAAVIGFTVLRSGGTLDSGDLYLLGGLVLCAAGYAEGGRLAARMPGWQVISWALVASLPVMIPAMVIALAVEPVHMTATSLAGVGYLALISQFAGFVAWYRGMALIGVAKASQLQLAQPLLALMWAVLLVGEKPSIAAPLTAVVVLGCIVVTQRAR